MPFNLEGFRSALQLDGARPNLFEVAMNFPTLALGGDTNSRDGLSVAEQLRFFCRAAQIPGSTVNPIPVNYFGRELKFAGNRTFPEWTVTIINDEDFKVRNAFELWTNGLNSHRGNLRNPAFVSSTGYKVQSTVTQFGKAGDTLKSYTFIGMFPIDISPIEVDHSANDTIEEYAVTFAYDWWESNPASGGVNGGERPKYNVPVF